MAKRPESDVPPSRRPRLPWARRWAGRPLALALGWLVSCALVTAVTLTAVERVGHEVSGPQPKVVNGGAVAAAINEQSQSAASASSASIRPTAAASTTHPAVTPPAPTPSPSSAPPQVRHTVVAPTPSSSHSTTPRASISSSPPASSSPTSIGIVLSGSPAPVTSATTPPSPSPPTGKRTDVVTGGTITVACSGDTIANASDTVDGGYKRTIKTSTAQEYDLVYTLNTSSYEYVYSCRGGKVIGTPEEQP